ncbi:MAG: thiolase family protein [Clostridiales bacterium]|nr:thiolase family protein [Clostridiales bacterium]
MSREVVFVEVARSAFGRQGGAFRDLPASELGGYVIKRLVEKSGIDPREIDGVVMGSAYNDLQTISLARYCAQAGGLPFEVTGTTVEMQCGSGIASINHAAWEIAMGVQDVVIAGGCESCSTAPAKFSTASVPYRMIAPAAVAQRLTPYAKRDISMIEISDNLAEMFGISREACDEFAFNSQTRLQRGYLSGVIGPEIVPYVYPATRKAPEVTIDKDEHPRAGTTMERLSKLASVRDGGVTTAGNASGLNDGAAFVLMMTAEKAKRLGYRPRARWIAGAHIGCEPELMGLGAGRALLKALRIAKLDLKAMDVIECNEAFAAQNLAVIRELEQKTGEAIDMRKWNPNGGAIAIGHPNGASGGRVCMFAMQQLAATGGKYGAFTSCCGGGQGTAAIVENLP